jgi:glycosyltransferase involved in cell wall biosynthesis
MRIAAWHNLPSGGGKRVLQYHLKGLAQRGHHIKFWHPPVPDNDFADLSVAGEEREVPLAVLPRTHRELINLARHARRARFDVRAMKEHCERCAQEIEAEPWDVLFTNTCRGFGAPFLGRYTSLPKILYLQEPHRPLYEPLPRLPWVALPEEVQRDWSFRGVKTRLRDLADVASARLRGREEQINAKAHDQILVNSLFSREAVLRAYGVDSRVCYLGIDTSLFRDLSLPRERVVVGLGSIVSAKNVELAIRAIGAMPNPRPPLHWIGNMVDGPFPAKMNKLAEELEVDFRITVMASDEELVEILNRASAMIYAPRLEPFGMAPLEANACGCPVVAVAEGGVRETIEPGRNGFLAVSDPVAVAEQLSRLLEDPALAERMGREAQELVRTKWNLEGAVDRVEQEIMRVVG